MISRRYITYINLVLALLLILSAGYLIWGLYRDRQRPVEEVHYSPLKPKEPEAPVPEEAYYRVIVSRDLWGARFEPPEEGPPPTPPPPPVPHPNLKLLGTSVSRDPSSSWAFIEDVASKTQKSYQVGDEIRGAKIMEINRTQVVLNHMGQRFVIVCFKDRIPVPPHRTSFSRAFRKIGENKWLVSRIGLWKLVNAQVLEAMSREGFFKMVAEDVIQALTTVGCRPYYPPGRRRRGEAEGYEIVVLPEGHLAAHLGVKQGDVIRSVNGEMITGKERALELLQEVQDEDRVVVEIKRGEELLNLEYIIQEEELEPEEQNEEGKEL